MSSSFHSVVLAIEKEFPCRQIQLTQLACLLAPDTPNLAAVIVHGLEATGKTSLIKLVLQKSATAHAIIQSTECITGRHLLESAVAACLDATTEIRHDVVERQKYAKCENLNALAVQLGHILKQHKKFVLVFDGIDRQREAPPTLLPALARLHEIIPCVTVVFIVTSPRQRMLQKSGVPHIHFPAYTRAEALTVVCRNPLSIFPNTSHQLGEENYTSELQAEDNHWLWPRFCGAVWDSFAKSAARDVVSFREIAEKLWPQFVDSIRDGTFGTRDFSRLMVNKRALFQDESVLQDDIVSTKHNTDGKSGLTAADDMPYYTKFLLCAAYLASYNPVRSDPIYFMKSSEKKRKRRGAGIKPGRPSKHRKIPRRLLAPSPFTLERLLAIFQAILPHPAPRTADILSQIATLTSLHLMTSTGVGRDVLDPSMAKWRVNVTWEYAVTQARSVGFEIADFVAE